MYPNIYITEFYTLENLRIGYLTKIYENKVKKLVYESIVEILEEQEKLSEQVIDKKVKELFKKIVQDIAARNVTIPGYGKLTEDKIEKILTDENEQYKFLKALGFSDKYIKQNKDLARKILEGKISMADGFNLFINQTIEEFKKSPIRASLKVWVIIFTLVVVIFVNTLMFLFLTSVTMNPIIGLVGAAVISAPIIEELYKIITVKLKMGLAGQVIFNALEFIQYVVTMTSIGVNPILAFLIRIIPLTMHLINTIRAQVADLYGKMGFRAKEFELYFLNALIHFSFNFLSSIAGVAGAFIGNLKNIIDFIFRKRRI